MYINAKATNYFKLVECMLFKVENLRAKMSIKFYHLFSHLDRFSENLAALNEE